MKIGDKLPKLTLPASGGSDVDLTSFKGRPLVVYFYPKDNTPGCTQEGAAFRDLARDFARADAAIVGVSPDGPASHEKFKAKMEFPFELLADEDRKVCELFDVIREKSMYGRKYLGVERSTFLIDAEGVLRREWRKVKVSGHAAEVLEAAKAL
jgi:peroxiredoxin Q/BCP